jgi:hypothetical protein
VESDTCQFSESFVNDLAEDLAEDGLEGWELVAVLPMGTVLPMGEDSTVRLCFIYKRPLREQIASQRRPDARPAPKGE